MSKNWGRTPVSDAGKRHKTQTTYFHDGESRIDRRPQGSVERFVDPAGNIVSLQIGSEGDSAKVLTADRLRMQFRRKGCVEHSKCPVRHGTAMFAGKIGKDFSQMPSELREPCASDPKVMARVGGDLHAKTGCPHIEWLVSYRREQARIQYEKQNTARIEAERQVAARKELELQQLEMVKEQLAERRSRKSKSKDITE